VDPNVEKAFATLAVRTSFEAQRRSGLQIAVLRRMNGRAARAVELSLVDAWRVGFYQLISQLTVEERGRVFDAIKLDFRIWDDLMARFGGEAQT